VSTTGQRARVIQTPRTERKGNILASWLSSTDHKVIGHMYLITSFFFFLCAGIMAMLIRIQLLGPDRRVMSDQQYNQLFTMHGAIMLLLFATPLFVGFANELLPLQIGSPDVAFPRLNILSYYMFTFGGLILLASFLTPGGAASFGWYAYSPLTSAIYSPGVVRRNPVLWSRATAAWLAREGRAHPAGLERTVACERCSLRLTEVPRSSPGQTLLFRTRGRGRSGSLCGRPA
jgi:hypothetical protein